MPRHVRVGWKINGRQTALAGVRPDEQGPTNRGTAVPSYLPPSSTCLGVCPRGGAHCIHLRWGRLTPRLSRGLLINGGWLTHSDLLALPGFSRRGSRPLRRDTPARVLEDRIIAPQAPLLIGKRHVKRTSRTRVALGCMRGQPQAVARIRTVAGARGPEEESKKGWTSADVSAGAFEQ